MAGRAVTVLFDPGSSHNLASRELLDSLGFELRNPRTFAVGRAGYSSREQGGTATLQLAFPAQADGCPFSMPLDVVVLPDLRPFDILVGKPWFSYASRTLGLEVQWDTNSFAIWQPGFTRRFSWTSPHLNSPPTSPDVSAPTTPTVDDHYTSISIANLILSPAQAARLLRKPFATRSFMVFPTLASDSPTTNDTTVHVNTTSSVPSNAQPPSSPHAGSPQSARSTPEARGVRVGASAPSAAIAELLRLYQHVFPTDLPVGLPPDRGAPFHIHTTPGSDPPHRPPIRLSFPEQAELRKQLRALIEHGYIQPSTSPYAAPVFFVAKADGSLRLVVDWRGLNAITVKNRVHLPNLDELFDLLNKATVFSKLDLQSGFYQLPVSPQDVPKTAIVTKFGNYEWKVMAMGLSNAPAAFQTLMHSVLQPYLGKFVTVFIDDILIFSTTAEEHLHHLRLILEQLSLHTLFAKPTKCELFATTITFLGHTFCNGTIAVDAEKTSAVRDWPTPASVVDVRRFVGLANFFRRFVPHFASLAAPLNDLLRSDAPRPFSWTPVHGRAFGALKLALVSPPTLQLPQFDRPFHVTTDASLVAIGAVLCQSGAPIAYFSAKLSRQESLLQVDERETLAVVRAILHWRHYLFCHFRLSTDSRIVRYLLTKRLLTRKQAAWVEVLSDFDFTVEHIAGKLNMADPLSRRPDYDTPSEDATSVATNLLSTTDWTATMLSDVRRGYPQDTVAAAILTRTLSTPDSTYIVLNEVLYLQHDSSAPRIYVPDAPGLRLRFLQALHTPPLSGHPGRDRMLELASRSIYWPGLPRDVRAFVKRCDLCQRSKAGNRNAAAPLTPLPIPDQRWAHISIDFLTGLPPSGPTGFDSIMTTVDRLTKRVHFSPTYTKASAEDIAHLFIDNIVRLHGLPQSIVSDRDSKFTSAFWAALMSALHISRDMSTANHPQADGQSERPHRTLQEVLRNYVSHQQHDWVFHLAAAEFSINNLVNTSTGFSPFYLDLGYHPTYTPFPLAFVPLPASQAAPVLPQARVDLFLHQQAQNLSLARDSILSAQEVAIARDNAAVTRRTCDLKVGDFVLVSSQALLSPAQRDRPSAKLAFPYQGPYRVLAVPTRATVTLQLPRNMRAHPVINKSWVKLYHKDPAQPSPPPSVPGQDGIPEYVVEAVLAHRQRNLGRGRLQWQFLVKWDGLDMAHNEWLPFANLVDERDQCINAQLVAYARAFPEIHQIRPTWSWH